MIERHTIMDMQRLDPDGVPSIVQYLWFEYHIQHWKATLFNGVTVIVPAEFVEPSLPLLQTQPTPLQRQQAFESITGLLSARQDLFLSHYYATLP